MSDAGLPYLRSLKSAIRGALRPASLIERAAPHGKWKWYDYTLYDAAQRVDEEMCRECGLPLYICRSENSEVQIDVRVDYCQGDVAVARKRKEMTPKEGSLPDGVKFSPDPYSLVGKPLSDYRKPYWDGVLAERKEHLDQRQQIIDGFTQSGS